VPESMRQYGGAMAEPLLAELSIAGNRGTEGTGSRRRLNLAGPRPPDA
jgi:hypothetical protein